MATAKRKRLPWFSIVLGVGVVLAVVWWLFGDNAHAYGEAGTAYAAQTACACRHISGRELTACDADLLSAMNTIWLSEDEGARSVTATMPLIADNTAQYRDGFGCVLEPWEG